MTIARLHTKRNDTRKWELTLLEGDVPVDLTNATGALLFVKKGSTFVVNAGTMVIDDAPAGEVSYSPSASEVDEAGRFNAEVEVTFANGEIATFPSNGYFAVQIDEDLGSGPST